MHIQVNTDNTIEGGTELTTAIEDIARSKLDAVAAQVTRIEVHLRDENAQKGGADDKRCMAEARPEGRAPVAVTHNADTVESAAIGALDKLRSALDRELGKLRARR